MRVKTAALILSLVLAHTAGCASAPRQPAATQVEVVKESQRRHANDTERALYAEREKQSSELQQFKGGAHGIIVIALLVILILVVAGYI